jgi:hypothetical protein
MSVHEKEEISIDELEDALESRNASIMEKWFNQTGPKELGEKHSFIQMYVMPVNMVY